MFYRFSQSLTARISSIWYGANPVSMNKSRKFAAQLIITIFLISFSGGVFAQDDDDEEKGMYIEEPKLFYGGLIIGANFAQVDGDYFAGYRKAGINVGAIAYAHIAKHVALSMEILYSQKGSRSNLPQASPGNPSIQILKYGINANYAEIPVMINYFDRRKSHFGVGVSYGRLVNSSESITIDTNNVISTVDFKGKYPFRQDAFDLLAGAELHLWKGLFLNVRFQYSLMPMRTELPPPEYARANQYNNVWAVRLMYLFQ